MPEGQWNAGPLGELRKPGRKHVQSRPRPLPGVGVLVPAVLLQGGNLELGEGPRSAAKMIKGSKGERGHMPC